MRRRAPPRRRRPPDRRGGPGHRVQYPTNARKRAFPRFCQKGVWGVVRVGGRALLQRGRGRGGRRSACWVSPVSGGARAAGWRGLLTGRTSGRQSLYLSKISFFLRVCPLPPPSPAPSPCPWDSDKNVHIKEKNSLGGNRTPFQSHCLSDLNLTLFACAATSGRIAHFPL